MSEPIHFDSCGVQCAADLYLPDAEKFPYPRPGVVLGHGFSIVKGALTSNAKYLADAGYVAMAIDYRTFGASEGEPRAQVAPLDQVEDFRNALSYLEARTDLVEPDRIGIWGVSFSGGVVLHAAAVDKRFKAVVSQNPSFGRMWQIFLRNPFENLQLGEMLVEERRRLYRGEEPSRIPFTMLPSQGPSALPGDEAAIGFIKAAEENLPGYRSDLTLFSLEKILEFFPERITDLIAPTPMLIIVNDETDFHHPSSHAQIAFDRAGEPKKFVSLPFGTVDLYAEPGLSVAMNHAIAWFDRHLAADARTLAAAEAETEVRSSDVAAAVGARTGRAAAENFALG